MSEIFVAKYKKPYDPKKRREYYLKYRELRLAKQKEYDAAHKEQRRIYAANRYRRKCGLPELKNEA